MTASDDKRSSPTASLRSEWRGLRAARLRAAWPRHLLTAALVVLVLLGLRALLWPPHPPSSPPPPRVADRPSEAFALQVARAYLTYDAADPAARQRALAPFLPDHLDADAGFFPGAGSRRVRWLEVASDQPALLGGRLITVAAGVSSQRLPLYLALPVGHRPGRGVSLLGYPAVVGAPQVDQVAEPAPTTLVDDRQVAAVVRRVLRNYLAGSATNLSADLAPDAAVTLPTLPLRLRSVEGIAWLRAPGSGAVLATLTATDRRGASYTLAYELGIERRERPYVDFIEVIPTAS